MQKAKEMCEYYGCRDNRPYVNSGAKFYHRELHIPLPQVKQIMCLLIKEGVFVTVTIDANIYHGDEPSKGFDPGIDTHKMISNWYRVDFNMYQAKLPIWSNIYPDGEE
jgi:hypothetical protein